MADDGPNIETPSLLITAMDEMKRVRAEPRLLVIITHGFVDLIINTLIDVRSKHPKRIKKSTHELKLLYLHDKDVLSDHHYALLKWFNTLRNKFAHQPLFTLTADQLSNFAKPAHRDLSKFDQLCGKIIVDLWMVHMFDIQHVFLPDAVTFLHANTESANDPAPNYMIPLKTDPKTIRRVTSHFHHMRITTPPHIQKMADDDEPSP